MAVPVFGWLAKKTFGTRNQRQVNRYLAKVAEVSAFEDEMRALTDSELMAKTDVFKERIQAGETPDALMAEIFSVAREAMDRSVGIRNIFNPEHTFDPSALSGEARSAYDSVLAEIESTPDAEPEDGYLGSSEPHTGLAVCRDSASSVRRCARTPSIE